MLLKIPKGMHHFWVLLHFIYNFFDNFFLRVSVLTQVNTLSPPVHLSLFISYRQNQTNLDQKGQLDKIGQLWTRKYKTGQTWTK